jgi:hypothetical protein
MSFLKNLFGKPKAAPEPVRRISGEPVQSEAERDSVRERMERELTASKESRASRQSGPSEDEKST